MNKKRIVEICTAVILMLLAMFGYDVIHNNNYARKLENMDFSLSINISEHIIKPYIKDNNYYFFIPKDNNLSDIKINYSGNIKAVSDAKLNRLYGVITGDFHNNSEFTIRMDDDSLKEVIIMQSDVPAIFIELDDNKTLSEVNNNSKDKKYKSSIIVSGCENKDNNISQTNIELKGRGNTSWTSMPKKSYQIKLSEKENFLGIGNSKEKKWLLIANFQDPTMMKNKIMNDLCINVGLSNCPQSAYADLYINGEYVGNYLVTDKIEIGKNRVNLKNEKGLLLEIDNAYYEEEEYKFKSSRGINYVLKEAVSEKDEDKIEDAVDSFRNSINELEEELYSEEVSWDSVKELIDVDSFAKYYLVNEFAENTDSYFSSCYMYKDGDSDKIHMGPTWDYDASFGFSKGKDRGEDPNEDFTLKYAYPNYMQQLYKIPEFEDAVKEIYNKSVKNEIEKIDIDKISNQIENAIRINTIVWSKENDYDSLKEKLNNFVNQRKTYYSSRYAE